MADRPPLGVKNVGIRLNTDEKEAIDTFLETYNQDKPDGQKMTLQNYMRELLMADFRRRAAQGSVEPLPSDRFADLSRAQRSFLENCLEIYTDGRTPLDQEIPKLVEAAMSIRAKVAEKKKR